ncbi:MAG: hypothetical protein ACRER2_15290 [Methylococcales bacterium]
METGQAIEIERLSTTLAAELEATASLPILLIGRVRTRTHIIYYIIFFQQHGHMETFYTI